MAVNLFDEQYNSTANVASTRTARDYRENGGRCITTHRTLYFCTSADYARCSDNSMGACSHNDNFCDIGLVMLYRIDRLTDSLCLHRVTSRAEITH